jgi:carboxylesterase
MNHNPHLQNPHLEGDPFLWQNGRVGVVLIHGFTATAAEVRPLGRILYEQGYTVAGPLLPGHNTRPEDLNRVRWQDWVAAVEEAYQKTSELCSPVFVGGESTGGILALYLASEHPEIAGVLAYAPALRLTLSPFERIRLHLAAPLLASVPKQSIDANHAWQGYRVNPLKGAIQLLRLQQEVRRRLPRITQPVLIVQGRQDLTVHPGVPDEIESRVNARIVEKHWMENSSHVVIVDKELDRVGEITLAFLQKI